METDLLFRFMMSPYIRDKSIVEIEEEVLDLEVNR